MDDDLGSLKLIASVANDQSSMATSVKSIDYYDADTVIISNKTGLSNDRSTSDAAVTTSTPVTTKSTAFAQKAPRMRTGRSFSPLRRVAEVSQRNNSSVVTADCSPRSSHAVVSPTATTTTPNHVVRTQESPKKIPGSTETGVSKAMAVRSASPKRSSRVASAVTSARNVSPMREPRRKTGTTPSRLKRIVGSLSSCRKATAAVAAPSEATVASEATTATLEWSSLSWNNNNPPLKTGHRLRNSTVNQHEKNLIAI